MEEDLRSFEAVNIGMTHVETGVERFARDGIYQSPPVAYWRNNLTALSQHYNLYFVASRDAIAVFRPQFPFQRLHGTPSLMIPPTLANPHAEGYIDPQSPHDINHMIVGDLGTEEIVLVATDSGNVTAYFTKTIDEAIRKDPYRFSTNGQSDYLGLRPFFAQWVQESAWGLSIHSQARLIAVAANTPHHFSSADPSAKITVFAFALTQELDEDEDAEEEDDGAELPAFSQHVRQGDWEEWDVHAAQPARDRNCKITLGGVDGHGHNIPSISFVNSDEDPDGWWLFSTDIGGEMKMWHIWRGVCIKSWNFAEKRMRSGFFRRQEGGWLVAALDPRAFRSAWTMEQFCGHSRAAQYHGHVGESYDISNVVRLRTPGNSLAHPSINDAPHAENVPEEAQDAFDSWSDMDQSDDESHLNPLTSRAVLDSRGRDIAHPSSALLPVLPSVGELEQSEENNEAARPDLPSDSADVDEPLDSVHHGHLEEEPEADEDEDEAMEEEDAPLSASSYHSTASFVSLARQHSEEMEQGPTVGSYSDSSLEDWPVVQPVLKHQGKARAGLVDGDDTPAKLPVIPVIHCSVSNLRLLMAPTADSPHVFCANILKQALPDELEFTNHKHLDRLDMLQQIPELGVVIIATQIGRCAICTTTRNEKTGTLGLRVDWTLPTRKQELKHARPYMPLLGISTSPIQGRFRPTAGKVAPGGEGSPLWGADGEVDGITTTFDPAVVVAEDSEGEESDRGGSVNQANMKRGRPAHDRATVEERAWKMPAGTESWQGTENSRRYRLMLTYLDMTVLTYEISRGVERPDLAEGEVSSLDLMD